MSREHYRVMAEETVAILQRGNYRTNTGRVIELSAWLQDLVARTRLYRPEDFPSELTPTARPFTTISEVTPETTLAAAHRLLLADANDEPFCLNFASAKNPGGGFLNGAMAQEESLARASGLYASLTSQMAMYEYNRQLGTAFYSDHMIYSPGVPVFRDDAGKLLEQPYGVTFLTAPAVNAGVVRQRELRQIPLLLPTMRLRLQRLVWVALQQGHTRLVLGAWGCGVFANDPYEIAALFGELFETGGLFAHCFKQITYAIYDRSPNRASLAPFQQRLAP